MAKEFPNYKILSVQPLVDENKDIDFKLRSLNKKQKETKMFTSKDFKKYQEDNDVSIVGNIRKIQNRYTNYADEIELRKQKRRKKIIGRAELQMPNDVKGSKYFKEKSSGNLYKYYDIREANKVHTVGYAWVGENKFLRVTTLNPLFFLIPIILALIILVCLTHCPQEVKDILHIEDGVSIPDDTSNSQKKQSDLWYFEPFDETTVLTKDNKEIVLKNLQINEGKWLCSYEIMVNGKTVHTTGAILPSNAVKYDLWSQLDAGTYELVCRSTEYDYNTHEAKGGHYNISTHLVIEK